MGKQDTDTSPLPAQDKSDCPHFSLLSSEILTCKDCGIDVDSQGNPVASTVDSDSRTTAYRNGWNDCLKAAPSVSSAQPRIEESALYLFHALRRAGKVDAAQAIAHLMEIYYYEDGHLLKDSASYLETLAELSDQEWPAIIGGKL